MTARVVCRKFVLTTLFNTIKYNFTHIIHSPDCLLTSTMAAPDMELKQAFAELQSKVVANKQQMKIHDMQIETLKRSITHSTLTDTEIAQLPKDTKVI